MTDINWNKMSHIIDLNGKWCHSDWIVHNFFTDIGSAQYSGSLIRYADTAGSMASIYVEFNRFVFYGTDTGYIVDLYDTSAGYSHRRRVIRENHYEGGQGGFTAFLRDYNGGPIEGSVGDNYSAQV